MALRRGGQIFRTAGFIHPLLKTTQNSLLIFGFKTISMVPARIAVEYTNTCSCLYWDIEGILILLTGRTQRNPGVQYESRCTSEICGIYLLALCTHRYLPVTSSACWPATHLRTYLRTYINTCPLTHLPTYRSINPSFPSHYPTIHPSKYLSGYIIPESLAVNGKRIFALLIKKFPTLRVENDHSCSYDDQQGALDWFVYF